MIEVTRKTKDYNRELESSITPSEARKIAKTLSGRLLTLSNVRNMVSNLNGDSEVFQEVGGFRINTGYERAFADHYGVLYTNSSQKKVIGFLPPVSLFTPRQRHAH